MSNATLITGFLLVGFSEERELQILHFVMFLAMYLIVLIGNVLIILLVALNTHLHTPMYFFLVNLSIVDLGTTSVTVLKSMFNALLNTTWISYSECVAQMLLFLHFVSSDLFLLTVMAYDRYVAICLPLHYMSLMNWGRCIWMVSGAWMGGFLNAVIHTSTIFSMPFCSNIVRQFFCEIPYLIKLACSDSYLSEILALVFSTSFGLGCGVFIFISYVQIFTTVFRMPSRESRQKAFSTCVPHITVVSMLVGTGVFHYFLPSSSSPYNVDQMIAVLYSVVPPMMNPIIYSMRNKDVKIALWKLFDWNLPVKNKVPHSGL